VPRSGQKACRAARVPHQGVGEHDGTGHGQDRVLPGDQGHRERGAAEQHRATIAAARAAPQRVVGPPSEASLPCAPARVPWVGLVNRGSMARPTAQASSAER